ncbi:MAG: hypothetical protein AAGI91_15120 [Bacteroidota bacterium]
MIYAILALMMIMFLSMNMQRGVGRDQQEQALNEVATQLTSVGTGVLDQIGTRHFDWHTWNYQRSRSTTALGCPASSVPIDQECNPVPRSLQPYCGRIADNGEEQDKLARPSGAGSTFGACSGLDCAFIEGLEAVRDTITRGEIDYQVDVLGVEYVDPGDFTRVLPGDSTSFAKKVTIEVTNPFLYVGDDPADPDAQFSLRLERVFTYGCTTDYESIPFVRATDPPPANQCPTPTPCSRWAW